MRFESSLHPLAGPAPATAFAARRRAAEPGAPRALPSAMHRLAVRGRVDDRGEA